MIMQEMMKQCCDDNSNPDLNKMREFLEKQGKQGFDEDQLAMMCQGTRFFLENNFCGPEGKPDAEQMKQLFEDCGCCCEP